MSTRKPLQIPITKAEWSLVEDAARREGLSLSQWARRQLRQGAERVLGRGQAPNPQEALGCLFALEAPVADVQTLIDQSIRGRFTGSGSAPTVQEP